MSTPTTPALAQSASDKKTPFQDSYGKFLYANLNHMGREDWLNLAECKILHAVQEPSSPTLWLLVPEEENNLYDGLIKAGYSFAFVSLLQVATRNGVKWIFFDEDHPLIAGLHVFEKEDAAWPLRLAGGVLQ